MTRGKGDEVELMRGWGGVRENEERKERCGKKKKEKDKRKKKKRKKENMKKSRK
jgi:hypothetical protein